MTFNNIERAAARGLEYVGALFYVNNTPNGSTSTALTDGEDSGAARLRTKSFDVNLPEADRTPQTSDNGRLVTIVLQPQETIGGTMTLAEWNAPLVAHLSGTKVYADGVYDTVETVPSTYAYGRVGFVINSPAKATDPTNFGNAGYMVREITNAEGQITGGGITENNYVDRPISVTVNNGSNKLGGPAYSETNDGTPTGAILEYASPYPVWFHTAVGDGSNLTVTLDYTPAGTGSNEVQVYDFTNSSSVPVTSGFTVDVGNKQITISSSVASAVYQVRYQFDPTA